MSCIQLKTEKFFIGSIPDTCQKIGVILAIITVVAGAVLQSQGINAMWYMPTYAIGGTVFFVSTFSALYAIHLNKKKRVKEEKVQREAVAKIENAYRRYLLKKNVKKCASEYRKQQVDSAVAAILTTVYAHIDKREREKKAKRFSEGLGNLRIIPKDVSLLIFSYLRPGDLCMAALVSRSFKVFSDTPQFWNRHLQNQFFVDINKTKEGKQSYQQYYRTYANNHKEYACCLRNYHEKNGILQEPLKLIDLGVIETFQGLYGIDLDEIGIYTVLADESEPNPLSLTPCIEEFSKFSPLELVTKELPILKNVSSPDKLSLSLTYRDGFKYVITMLNCVILQRGNQQNFFIGRTPRSVGIFRDIWLPSNNAAHLLLMKISHSKPDLVRRIRKLYPYRKKIEYLKDPFSSKNPQLKMGAMILESWEEINRNYNYTPWLHVILQVLKDKGLIFHYTPSSVFANRYDIQM